MKAWQDGALSAEDVARDLKMGGYIDPSRDLADVTAEIEAARGQSRTGRRNAAMMEQLRARSPEQSSEEDDDDGTET